MNNCKKIFLALAAVGLCFSLFLNWQRWQVEKANNQIENVMEYNVIERLAKLEGIPEEQALKEFKDRGVTTLALFDTTLDKLSKSGKITMVTGPELAQARTLGNLSPVWQKIASGPEFVNSALYISKGTGDKILNDVEEDLTLRFGKNRVKILSENPKIIRFTGDLDMIKDYFSPGEQKGVREMDLGTSSDELAAAKRNGFMVAIRPTNHCEKYTSESASPKTMIDSFFNRLDKSGADISLFIGSGKVMLGNDKYLPYVAEQLTKRKITLGITEAVNQLQFATMTGVVKLAEDMNYQVARNYVIDALEQKPLSMGETARRWSISDEERNVRINYIKPFLTTRNDLTLMQTNLDYVKMVTDSVKARGFTFGRASIFETYFPQRILWLPLAFSAIAAGLFYLQLLVPFSKKKYLSALIILGLGAGVLLVFSTRLGLYARQAIALTSAVIYPVLAMHFVLNYWNKKKDEKKSLMGLMGSTTGQLIITVLFSLIGASLVGAVLSDIRFFQEMDLYRGVKITFVLPVILMAILFCEKLSLWEGDNPEDSIIKRIGQLLSRPFTLKILIALGILGFVAWVFIGRSGHTAGVPVPALEMKLRIFLQEAMYARPREKEFIIGHPCFYLAAFAAYKKLPNLLYLIFVLGATIGQASLVETFAHLRTPILMSYVRAAGGLGFGIVLGIVALLIFALLYSLWQKNKGKLARYE
jgi:hypothetical protein